MNRSYATLQRDFAHEESAMIQHHPVLRRFVLLTLLVLGGTASAQPDESMADLRRENEALRQRIAQLEAQLATAREEAEGLREANRVLLRQLERTPPAPSPPPEPVATPDEAEPPVPTEAPEERRRAYPDPASADPFAFPDALLSAIQRSHDDAMGSETLDKEQPGAYFGALRRWANSANRAFRGRIDWVVSVSDERGAIPAQQPVRIFVVDPETLQPLHREAFIVELSSRDRRRVAEESSRPAWRIIGQITSQVRVNPDRPERGVFNTPVFLGPFAEFDYELRVLSVSPWNNTEKN
ncbi:MAG: hypothetical protein EA380_02650 [Phycisphaeraceae bacterium]|nr:MAG: hypothetical protein EA380_02650 [Phycisphaeraceae bacterium]